MKYFSCKTDFTRHQTAEEIRLCNAKHKPESPFLTFQTGSKYTLTSPARAGVKRFSSGRVAHTSVLRVGIFSGYEEMASGAKGSSER